MAYCLRSFVETLDQVLNPHKHYKKWVLDHHHRPQIQSLFENATFLQDFLDKSSPQIQKTISSLEARIMNAAEKAADTLETLITDQILLIPKDQGFTFFPPDLGEVIQVFKDAKQELSKIKDPSRLYDHIVLPPGSSTLYPDSKMVVGVEEDLDQLRDWLTCRVTKHDIIPIVGMGGIGKTTLARILYDEYSSSKSHFDRFAWVTVSQRYDPQQILRTLLSCITKKEIPQHTSDLITPLYRALVGCRYLIVLDDIWTSEAWNCLQKAFARDNQGSRVIFTTRVNSLADHVKSSIYEMHLINDDNSWELLKGKVFGERSCPPELEEVGKRIALKCGGLPLAIQVIGGLLSHSQYNKDFWDYVSQNVSSLIATTDDKFDGIFSLSFAHLPHYLKPCFLYMGVFPENYEIPTSRLIKLWVAEGFLYPVPNKSLEEAAEIHLNELVHRNLIFVRSWKYGKVKSYGIHDLLRDLCLRKAREMKFFSVIDSETDICQENTLCLHRVSIHLRGESDNFRYLKTTSLARSFLLTGYNQSGHFESCLCFNSSLLRVLDISGSEECQFPRVFLYLVNLRYLAISFENYLYAYHMARDISVLMNLQTLIVPYLESLAIIEHLPQLRHLKFLLLKNHHFVKKLYTHENLQRLSTVVLNELHYVQELPNLRKLGLQSMGSDHGVVDLTCFPKLESLTFHIISDTHRLFGSIIFPQALKKLKVVGYKLISQTLNEIGIPPGLQVLILKDCEFEDSTWEPTKGEFCQLQYLKIENSNLKNWFATEIHFPVLRHLVIKECHYLCKIPDELGGIETLETIEMDFCRASLFDSATMILEEQLEFGDTFLQLPQLGGTIDDFENEDAEKRLGIFERDVLNHGLSIKHANFSLDKVIFPHSLKKLNLIDCTISQTVLNAMRILPGLQVLTLEDCKLEGSTWEPSDDEMYFPVLKELIIRKCTGLVDIPIGIRRIRTLTIIKVEGCSPSLVESARNITSWGNTKLRLEEEEGG